MYIALQKNRGQSQYILRHSCTIDDQLTFQDLFDLGADPSVFIKYPGGNAFYFDEKMEDALFKSIGNYDADELEDLFWPWIRPDIKRAVDTFRNRSSNRTKQKLTRREKEDISARVHNFDKRRIHYFKFKTMDQGPIEAMPAVLFKAHVHQSRDEIEQSFLRLEYGLEPHELKSYVYTVFNLQQFFSGMLAKKMPHALDQERVDTHFLKRICQLNTALFNRDDELDDYMKRYVIMFFDNPYADTTLLDEFARNFMNRHRFFTPRPEKFVPTDTACKIFCLTRSQVGTMTRKDLTKLYRRLARQVHPDTGGSHEKFVELNTAYEALLDKVGSR